MNSGVPYTEAEKTQILAAYYERPSMRGIERIFGVAFLRMPSYGCRKAKCLLLSV